MIRQPIITLLGHVDHGKTTILDKIRGSTLAKREAGKITQHIGATEVPIGSLKKVCGNLLELFNLKFTIPGLLFIDTPGHEAFTNLRKRGGSLADIAILVVDINQGIQPQTKEAIKILKSFKTPFIIAATKTDMINEWETKDKTFIKNLKKQTQGAKESYEKKFYNLLGDLSKLKINANIYNKVDNYTKNVAIIPVSGKTGEGIAELLALLTGLSQKFMKKKLKINPKESAKGTVLEIKETQGMGTTADVIIYSGSLKKEDQLIFGGASDIFQTRIRSILKPQELSEIRDKKSKFKHISKIVAASGIKISAPNLDRAVAGAPFASARNEEQIKKAKKSILKEIKDILIEKEKEGIILKADTLGSLEAAINLLKQKEIPIKRADIGEINKKDILEAASHKKENPELAFVLGFNVKCKSSLEKIAEKEKVGVVCHPVIYKIIEDFEEKLEEVKKQEELEKLSNLSWPAKIKILPQYIFRQSNPAIFGVEVLGGKLKKDSELINKKGITIGQIKNIEDSGQKLEKLEKGEQAAISVQGLVLGKQAEAGEEIYTKISEKDFRQLKQVKEILNGSEKQILREISEIQRQKEEFWGI